ncbi:MAG: hypothetical protein EA390_04510 [Balneolaceae bacterium]|nr:MAG: hypothetical protein EA390_04510 [Balneolaceae bacterium]
MYNQKFQAAIGVIRMRLIVYKSVDHRKSGGNQQPYHQLFDKRSLFVWKRLAHAPFVGGDSEL